MLADDQESKVTSTDKDNKKSEKSLSIGARITDHDLASRLKNIAKWLNKRHEVRILIQGSVGGTDEGNAERIVKTIETTIKEPKIIGKIVQKRQKGAHIKFSILPVSTASTASSTTAPVPGGNQLWQPQWPLTELTTQSYSYSTYNSERGEQSTVMKRIGVVTVSTLFFIVVKYTIWLRILTPDEVDIDAEDPEYVSYENIRIK